VLTCIIYILLNQYSNEIQVEDKLAKSLIRYNGLLRTYSYHVYIIIANFKYVFIG